MIKRFRHFVHAKGFCFKFVLFFIKTINLNNFLNHKRHQFLYTLLFCARKSDEKGIKTKICRINDEMNPNKTKFRFLVVSWSWHLTHYISKNKNITAFLSQRFFFWQFRFNSNNVSVKFARICWYYNREIWAMPQQLVATDTAHICNAKLKINIELNRTFSSHCFGLDRYTD